MSVALPARLTVADLESILKAREPAALLVPSRILRRVLERDRGLTVFGLRADKHGHVLARETLLRIAERRELGVRDTRGLPTRVYLFARPDAHWLAENSADEVLRVYWRRLFHARVRVELERRAAQGLLTDAVLHERIQRIGWTEFDEARAVLRQENLLAPTDPRATAYREFVALYQELTHFAPQRLAAYFPGLAGRSDLDAVVNADVDAADLLQRTQLDGAAAAAPSPAPIDADSMLAPTAATATTDHSPNAQRLLNWARHESEQGNVVRAAVFAQRAGSEGAAAVAAAIDTLVARLHGALHLRADELPAWRDALGRLAPAAARGLWPSERRLLYDLQRACVDTERPVYALDLFEWARTGGRRPIRRPLPDRVPVLVLLHLRRAAARLDAARIAGAERDQLRHLLHGALDRCEAELRARIRPVLVRTLAAVDLRATCAAEDVAHDKLIEELLDRVVERGFLTLGDLRDGLARNRLKLPDVANAADFLRGDSLLRANQRLAEDMGGVYRRGEIYLRLLQRISALAFGTRVGRAATLYLALPFLGAYVLLEFLQHVVDPVAGLLAGAETASTEEVITETLYPKVVADHGDAPHHVEMVNRWSMGLVALFLFGVINSPAFRGQVLAVLRWLWRGVRRCCWDWPRALLELPLVRELVQSWSFRLVWRLLLKPALYAGIVFVVVRLALVPFVLLHWITAARTVALAAAVVGYAVSVVLLNSRWGKVVEEVLTDRMAEGWYWFHNDVVPGLLRGIVAFFKWLVEEIERLLYAVDEWLRFRPGDSRLSMLVKPVLATAWAGIAYVVRFTVNLLIEPQINPIKHFPVVTVSHKVMLTIAVPLSGKVQGAFGIETEAEALALTTLVLSLVPGIFGFLVWELKENWRLYRVNQSPTLEPDIVGHHGETVPRLLRPGFHSGTVPKLFARLRRAEGRKSERHQHALEQVREAMRHFVERGLLATLAACRRWDGVPVELTTVSLATNRISVGLRLGHESAEAARLDFEEHAGHLSANLTIHDGAWKHLNPGQIAAFADALAGAYKHAGVDVVCQSLRELMPPGTQDAVTDDGLLVWSASEPAAESLYPLDGGALLACRPPRPHWPALPAADVYFRSKPVFWKEWVTTWECDRQGEPPPPLAAAEALLPRPVRTDERQALKAR